MIHTLVTIDDETQEILVDPSYARLIARYLVVAVCFGAVLGAAGAFLVWWVLP